MMDDAMRAISYFCAGLGVGVLLMILDELAQMVIKLYGKDSMRPEFLPERPGDIKDSYADISLAKKVLGYSP